MDFNTRVAEAERVNLLGQWHTWRNCNVESTNKNLKEKSLRFVQSLVFGFCLFATNEHDT